jgi:GNAT superfamily N-acetyltransferase
MLEIRTLRSEDCISVAEAHINYLTTPFRGKAGVQLLKIYYEVIAEGMGGIGFVAFKDEQIVGFVCGIWDRPAIKRALLKRWDKLVIYGVRQSLQIPKVTPGFIRRLLNPQTTNIIRIEGYELRPMVVIPDYRGQGIADQLALRLLNDAKQRGFKQVFLVVENNNFVAEKLYTKLGFTFERQIDVAGNIMKLFSYSFSRDSIQ